MDLNELLEELEFKPNPAQREAIETTEGPVLIIAGPGSGKTQTLIIRTLNLLVVKEVPAENVMVCTFTEKAAATLKDRLRQSLIKLGLETEIDISDLWVGTIHSLCNEIIRGHLDRLEGIGYELARGYNVLDELTQKLFIYENYYRLFGTKQPFSKSKWQGISMAASYFDRITEELVDPDELEDTDDEFLQRVGKTYKRYRRFLWEKNDIDFAHLQRIVLEMVMDKGLGEELRSQFRYVLVDEYQDTNYIQERLFLELTEESTNICVVGDEDQALYRFRGATVQNILQFQTHFKGLEPIVLDLNYRSRPSVVDFVNEFMKSGDWGESQGKRFRYPKTIREVRKAFKSGIPSVFKTVSGNGSEEVAGLVKNLIDNKVVEDANQIAVLLKSVRYDAAPIMEALEAVGVEYHAPRARGFFDLDDVKAIIGSLLFVFDHLDAAERWNPKLYTYYDSCLDHFHDVASVDLLRRAEDLRDWMHSDTQPSGRQKGVVDIFYELLGHKPFSKWREDEMSARNLAIISDLFTKFQDYYHERTIRVEYLEKTCQRIFNSYVYMLWRTGLDEYESPYDIFPKGTVQIMTVHQAKGLEFPVVIVDSLHKQVRGQSGPVDKLRPYMERELYEPPDSIAEFDYRRLYYVAFSRARDLLVLFSDKNPGWVFRDSLEGLPDLDTRVVRKIVKERFKARKMLPVKREFGITSDIHVYDVCPKQYLFYNEYDFSPSIAGQFKFGMLVHHTIEDIHNHYLNGKGAITDDILEYYFQKNLNAVTRGGSHPIGKRFIKMANKQVKKYVDKNKDMFDKIIAAEVPITVEKKDYILGGVVDLIQGEDGQPELLDFKAQQRKTGQSRLEFYKQQLALYSRIVAEKLDIKPVRHKIYWTGEENPDETIQELDVSEEDSRAAEKHFDMVVRKIESGDFEVKETPPRDVCRNCDFRFGCDKSSA